MKKLCRGSRMVFIAIATIILMGMVSNVQAQERTEILIGASIPLSGSLSAHGRDMKWAYEAAVNAVNSNGGIFVKDLGKKLKVKLITLDNGTNAMKSATVVERLINFDKVDLMLGGAEAVSVMTGCMVAEKYKTYYHTSFAFPEALWKQKNFKWCTNYFVSTRDMITPPFEILKGMDSQRRPKKLALIAEDTFAGNGYLEVLRKMAGDYGMGAPLEIKLPVGSSDYSQQVAKAREAGTDCMVIFTTVTDLETFVRQLKKDKVRVPFIYTWKGGWSGKFWRDLGKDAQYVVVDGFWSMDYPFEGAKDLGEKYHQEFGEYSITVGLFYGLAQILFQAIEKAGSIDGAKVRDAVLSNHFNTVMGPVTYPADGHATFPVVAAQWWDGKQMLVYPAKYATWQLKLAPSGD